MIINIVIYFSCILILFIVYINYFVFKYWKRKGVPYLCPSFPFGNLQKVFMGKISFTDQIGEFYNELKNKGKYSGLYFLNRKVLFAVHPEFIKNVLNKDFQSFHSRGMYFDEENEPLSANLVSLNGEKWKILRTKLTPTFTPNKLKVMFEVLLQCAEEMCSVVENNKCIEIKDLATRYTTDIVGSTAFGIECNSLKNPNAEFREMVKLATTIKTTPINFVKRILFRNFPAIAKKLKLKTIDPVVSTFFLNTVKNTIDYRIKNNINRNDFLELLMNLLPKENGENCLTVEQIAAQCFVFFIAGVETSAATITFALYELAKNTNMQQKLRDEIVRISDKDDGKLTYSNILEMHYMDKIILETLRKYPAFTILMRRSTDTYSLPDSNIILEKGTTVLIPLYAIQHDSNFYPNPEEFDPDRFNEEEMKTRSDNIYIPFGDGPRICIGRRFAMFQVKLAIASLIRRFEFTLNERSKEDLVMDRNSFILNPKNGVYFDATLV